MITIFTPTYNRAYILPNLYQSLCDQTNQDFTWLIVDDGSSDNTRDLISQWIDENKIKIYYDYQQNQGKSAAHNRGVYLTETELFVCVDSDDELTVNAVNHILQKWKSINSNESNIRGILAFRKKKSGAPITQYNDIGKNIGSLKSFYDHHVIQGDTMLVFQTNVLKNLEFPVFQGEKFIPEAYLYDQFDRYWKLAILPEYLYVCDYLDDGYTKNMARLIAHNPNGYLAYIEKRLAGDDRIPDRIVDTIRYIAIAICAGKSQIIQNAPYPSITMLVYPLGKLFYKIRYYRYEE